jgi:hypothetical protein
MSRSEAQRAENESTFRLANEDLAAKAESLAFGDQQTPYLCECEDERCTEVVMLGRSEYEDVRGHPRQFVVVPGHDASGDDVIAERGRFHVVEKRGEEGRLVEQQDPRS